MTIGSILIIFDVLERSGHVFFSFSYYYAITADCCAIVVDYLVKMADYSIEESNTSKPNRFHNHNHCQTVKIDNSWHVIHFLRTVVRNRLLELIIKSIMRLNNQQTFC